MANQAPLKDKSGRVYVLTCNLPHPGDRHLSVVLYQSSDGRWVTWLHNHEAGGDTCGHYFNNETDARKDFALRVADYMQNYLESLAEHLEGS